ncbi:MAG: hypothetical protein WCL32_21120, partial [Planctomycetota bacterium]
LIAMRRREHWNVDRLPLAILLNVQVFCLIATWICPGSDVSILSRHATLFALPFACAAAASLVAWQFLPVTGTPIAQAAAANFLWILRAICVGELACSIGLVLTPFDILLAGGAFLLLAASELLEACGMNSETRVWTAEAILGAGALYFIAVGVLTLHRGFGMFILLGLGVALSAVRILVLRSPSLAVLDRPLHWTSLTMPMAAVALGIVRHLTNSQVVWMGANSLALLLAAAFYFWRGLETGRKSLHVLAAIILNIAIAFLARELTLTDPQFFMIPIGISALALVELLKREIPESFHNPLRYAGALVILVSPTYSIVGGSWIHLITLMIASVAVALLAIGLRVRALLYTGTAFLAADLTAMLVRTSMYDANILWIAGLLLGGGIIALGAYCEKHREELISRMHLVASTLKTWE